MFCVFRNKIKTSYNFVWISHMHKTITRVDLFAYCLPHEILNTQLTCTSLQGLLPSPMGSRENASVHFLLILCSLIYLTATCSPPDAEKLDCLQRGLCFRMNCCYLIISISPFSAVLFLSWVQPQQPSPASAPKGLQPGQQFLLPCPEGAPFPSSLGGLSSSNFEIMFQLPP